MTKITSEAKFEEHIEQLLVERHEFLRATQDDYDRDLCLRPKTVLQFLRATQPKKWADYCEVIGDKAEAEQKFIKRVKEVIEKDGTLHLLRKGFDIHGGGHFEMCFFHPTSGIAEESLRLSKANLFHVQRQLHFSGKDEKSVDMVIFLNGLPIFTAELKNQQSGQGVWHGMKQYREDRDPREPLFRFRRCLAHFAVDNDQVYMTTELASAGTFFLPFNRGNAGGAGNEPSLKGFATGYLWEEVLGKTSILDLIQRFIRVVDVLDDKGKPTGKMRQIFPRFHQLSSVRALTAHAKANGAGHAYLNQHSAGSGKTNCIAWLANSLATLHGKDDKPVFSSVIVISDRRVIDRQLQRTLSQVVETKGMLVNIDPEEGLRSKDLKAALEDGKRIVVTTLQKFGVIVDSMKDLPGETFAVIVDEAHSSQAGESAAAVQKVLSYASLKDAKDEDENTVEDRIAEELRRRGRMKNVSYFAFTATPKEQTLELFGTRQKDGSYRPFSLYSMRQAIEEGFILDVLRSYTTYDQYWHLLKKIKDDPAFEEMKAKRLLKSFVSRHEQTIAKKVRIIVDHFTTRVHDKIGGKAKAMIVTASRLHAVRYRLALDEYLKKINSPFRALVAFTDTVKDPKDAKQYTEAGMNGFPEAATADRFESDEYRFLVVASKFQTGFDQPKLAAMYVDRKLQGVMSVQTLSRLNRMAPAKETFVLDFENEFEDVEKAFRPYYDRIMLTRETNPNKLYDIRADLANFEVYRPQHVEDFAKVWFAAKPSIARLHAITDPLAAVWKDLEDSERADFKSKVRDYVKLYGFLTQLIRFEDPGLEKLFVLLRFLIPKLTEEKGHLPHEIVGMVDMEKLAIRKQGTKDIGLKRGEVGVNPLDYGAGADISEEEREVLSKILDDLNTRYNTTFTADEILVIKGLEKRLSEDEALREQLKNGSLDAVRASFDQVALDAFEDLVDQNFRFYKKVKDDRELSHDFFARLFDWYYQKHGGPVASDGKEAAQTSAGTTRPSR
jgi:type I restriction enzyme R subunit